MNIDSMDRTAKQSKPSFLITIDTEGDNLWECRPSPATHNARYLPRFQQLCEKYDLKPTYLTNYEMVCSEFFVEFARDVLMRDTAEIGMHLHAWDSPPHHSLSNQDEHSHPYLIEYPSHVMLDKICCLTDRLEQTFQVKMTSHRAGRWAFNERYAGLLVAQGYLVDCSVTPYVSWRDSIGASNGKGGVDYSGFPEQAYFINPDNICSAGVSPLLEVPVTIRPKGPTIAKTIRRSYYKQPRLVKSLLGRLYPLRWLRPNGRNLDQMLALLECIKAENEDYAEFMLHSSELMPGGSPTFKTEDHIRILYDHLENLFAATQQGFQGATLMEYYRLQRR